MVTNDHLWWQFQEVSLKIRKSCNKTFDDMGDTLKSTNLLTELQNVDSSWTPGITMLDGDCNALA